MAEGKVQDDLDEKASKFLQTDEDVLESFSRDFHLLQVTQPRAVARVETEDEVVTFMKWANKKKERVVVRTNGHGQNLTMPQDSILLDISSLRQVHSVSESSICIGAGASWKDVIDALERFNVTTAAQTDWQGLSVGGVLSIGGLGPAVFREGLIIDSVLEIRVVTATGLLVDCNAQKNSDLFRCVLGGVGQCGVIVRATMKAVPRPKRAKVFRVVTTFESMKRSYEGAKNCPSVHNLQTLVHVNVPGTFTHACPAFASLVCPSDAGKFVFLHEFVSFHNEAEGDKVDDDELLGLFEPLTDLATFVEDVPYEQWIYRLCPILGDRAETIHEPAWQSTEKPLASTPRPWLELFFTDVDLSKALDAAWAQLDRLDVEAGDVPIGSVLIIYALARTVPLTSDVMRMRVEAHRNVGVYLGLLRVATSPEQAQSFQENDEKAVAAAFAAGMGYPYGHAPKSAKQWKEFLGQDLEKVRDTWTKFDPNQVLAWRCCLDDDE